MVMCDSWDRGPHGVVSYCNREAIYFFFQTFALPKFRYAARCSLHRIHVLTSGRADALDCSPIVITYEEYQIGQVLAE